MRYATLALVLLGAGAAPLEELNRAWNQAWLDKDAAAVERLMAPGYAYVAPGGQVLDREAVLAIVRSPAYRPARGTRTEVQLRSLGPDTATLVNRWQGSGTYEGRPYTDDHRCTMVCVRRGRAWQVAAEHCSAITPDEAAAEAGVRRAEARRVEALLKADVGALDPLLAPDLTYMHSSGVLDTKESFLSSLSSGTLKYLGLDESDLRVRVYGDLAVLTGRAAVRAARGNESVALSLALTGVYAKGGDGGWRLVAWQTTRLPQ